MKPTINAPEPLVSPYAGADLFDCSKLIPEMLSFGRGAYDKPTWQLLQPNSSPGRFCTLVGKPFWSLISHSSVFGCDAIECYDLGSSSSKSRLKPNYAVLLEGDPTWSNVVTPEMVIAWMDQQGVPRADLPG